MIMTRVYPGSATLEDTQRACKVDQQNKGASLTSLKPATLKKDGSPDTKVNVADYKKEPLLNIPNILNELKFIDTSTPQGTSDAAAARGTFTFLFECQIFVQDQLKQVQVFAKKVAR